MQLIPTIILAILIIILSFVIARLAERLKNVEKQLTEIVRKRAIEGVKP
jgi:hypothetical protein